MPNSSQHVLRTTIKLLNNVAFRLCFHGKRQPRAPRELNRVPPAQPSGLILPWNIASEVISQNSYVREWGGEFVTAIPEIRVIN